MGEKREKFNFENLSVYQKSLLYIDFVYKATAKFPNEERFGLASQFRRAVQSIALNIGEGSGGSNAEFKQFIRISRRSVRECIVCTTIAKMKRYITEEQENKSRDMCLELSKMLSGLLSSLKRLQTPSSKLLTPN
ncbi:four helix bundle protein [Patescibacteria group bacterium]|nr:four helix bundle protein [Patescibacteria group bacterium]